MWLIRLFFGSFFFLWTFFYDIFCAFIAVMISFFYTIYDSLGIFLSPYDYLTVRYGKPFAELSSFCPSCWLHAFHSSDDLFWFLSPIYSAPVEIFWLFLFRLWCWFCKSIHETQNLTSVWKFVELLCISGLSVFTCEPVIFFLSEWMCSTSRFVFSPTTVYLRWSESILIEVFSTGNIHSATCCVIRMCDWIHWYRPPVLKLSLSVYSKYL